MDPSFVAFFLVELLQHDEVFGFWQFKLDKVVFFAAILSHDLEGKVSLACLTLEFFPVVRLAVSCTTIDVFPLSCQKLL